MLDVGAVLVGVPFSRQPDFLPASFGGRTTVGREGLMGVAEPWLTNQNPDPSSELQQLMKNLDISEHLHVLKVR